MPASIEGATPANTGLCAFAMGTRTRKKEKNTHFRNTFITQGGKTSLPPYQTPRRVVILSVDLGLGRPKSAETSRNGTRHSRTWETRTYILIHTTEKKLLTRSQSMLGSGDPSTSTSAGTFPCCACVLRIPARIPDAKIFLLVGP